MKLRKFFYLSLVFVIMFGATLTVNAAPPASPYVMPLTSLDELPNVTVDDSLQNASEYAIAPFALSAQKTQTKPLYATDGTKIGTVTLKYKTEIVNGRPQFVYKESKVAWNVTDTAYHFENPSINFTGDLITVHFILQYYFFTETATVSFMP